MDGAAASLETNDALNTDCDWPSAQPIGDAKSPKWARVKRFEPIMFVESFPLFGLIKKNVAGEELTRSGAEHNLDLSQNPLLHTALVLI